MESKSLDDLFRAAAILTGPSSTTETRPADLTSVVQRRLNDYYIFLGAQTTASNTSLEAIQLDTSIEALTLLEYVHMQLTHLSRTQGDSNTKAGPHLEQKDPALVGTRDLALIRTLISIVFRWGVEPLIQHVTSAIPSTSTLRATKGARIIDLTELPQEYSTLSSVSSRLLALPLSDGMASPLAQSAVSATLLNQSLSDLLLPCIVVGWLPKSLSSDSMPTADALRPQVMYLLSRYVALTLGLPAADSECQTPRVTSDISSWSNSF